MVKTPAIRSTGSTLVRQLYHEAKKVYLPWQPIFYTYLLSDLSYSSRQAGRISRGNSLEEVTFLWPRSGRPGETFSSVPLIRGLGFSLIKWFKYQFFWVLQAYWAIWFCLDNCKYWIGQKFICFCTSLWKKLVQMNFWTKSNSVCSFVFFLLFTVWVSDKILIDLWNAAILSC